MSNIIYQITQEELEKIGEQIANNLWAKMSAPTEDAGKHYTRQECCQILRCSMPTFHALANKGLIPIRKVGRKTLIPAAEFDSIVASGMLAKFKRHPAAKKEGGVSYGR